MNTIVILLAVGLLAGFLSGLIGIGGGITVAQNGEIYNYVELRQALERAGDPTATACDTEVIAHLYAAEGVGGFKRMRGMFALAIYDKRKGSGHERLLLARDQLGIKPLLYTNVRGQLDKPALQGVLRRQALSPMRATL